MCNIMESHLRSEIDNLNHKIEVLKMERTVDQEEVTGHREAERLLASERDKLKAALKRQLIGLDCILTTFCYNTLCNGKGDRTLDCGSDECIALHMEVK